VGRWAAAGAVEVDAAAGDGLPLREESPKVVPQVPETGGGARRDAAVTRKEWGSTQGKGGLWGGSACE